MRCLFIAVFAAFTLGGCAGFGGTSPSDAAGDLAFNVQEAYRGVYERVSARARECFRDPAYTVHEDLFAESRSGHLSVARKSTGAGAGGLLMVDMRSVGPGITTVDVYYGDQYWKERSGAFEAWAKGESRACPAP